MPFCHSEGRAAGKIADGSSFRTRPVRSADTKGTPWARRAHTAEEPSRRSPAGDRDNLTARRPTLSRLTFAIPVGRILRAAFTVSAEAANRRTVASTSSNHHRLARDSLNNCLRAISPRTREPRARNGSFPHQ